MRDVTQFPGEELLIDGATWEAWFGPDVSEAERANNISRRVLELALEYLTRPLLQRRCDDLAAGTSKVASSVYSLLQRVYTIEELDAMDLWGRMDGKIASLGGCANVSSSWPGQLGHDSR